MNDFADWLATYRYFFFQAGEMGLLLAGCLLVFSNLLERAFKAEARAVALVVAADAETHAAVIAEALRTEAASSALLLADTIRAVALREADAIRAVAEIEAARVLAAARLAQTQRQP